MKTSAFVENLSACLCQKEYKTTTEKQIDGKRGTIILKVDTGVNIVHLKIIMTLISTPLEADRCIVFVFVYSIPSVRKEREEERGVCPIFSFRF